MPSHRVANTANGLSPRVRGNLVLASAEDVRQGSIPAGAGQPIAYLQAYGALAVYPRGCGATCHLFSPLGFRRGLSPRVRGNRSRLPSHCATGTVYPRGCGATRCSITSSAGGRGLSPRVRGNRIGSAAISSSDRSIPAGAGQPKTPTEIFNENPVYPRGCGATPPISFAPMYHPGLSPRVRGNRGGCSVRGGCSGSIPAGAGQPFVRESFELLDAVYPRGCGATPKVATAACSACGLSPRVRGNRCTSEPHSLDHRSIPAGAGQPTTIDGHRVGSRVYPRGCGATVLLRPYSPKGNGLSPRVRGNPAYSSRRTAGARSIPAGAGQPLDGHLHQCRRWVYPRGCGATFIRNIKPE